ncbi:hypothetical protein ACNKHP_14025 [Shigella boydii]
MVEARGDAAGANPDCCVVAMVFSYLIKMLRMLTIVSMQQITLPESAYLYAVLQNEE